MNTLLQGKSIVKEYVREGFLGTSATKIQALRGIDFSINNGEILGIVGESGSGKSTLAKIICGLEDITSGELFWKIDRAKMRRKPAQMVFQNPFSSLNPKLSVGYMLREAAAYGSQSRISDVNDSEISDILINVGMKGITLTNYPHQFSGGQRQRLGIARALALKPDILICDEPVSALDISIQAQIINLLIKINRNMDLAIIFISHDIEVVSMISENIIVMKDGSIMEYGTTEKVINAPEKDYTRMLLNAVPKNPWL